MANPSKAKGTNFETAVVRYLQRELDDERIERRALHGAQDRGDVYGIRAHGLAGIAECKDYRSYTDHDLTRWKAQTLAERGNADADFALLVVHRRGKSAKAEGKSFGENVVWVTVADLMRIAGISHVGAQAAGWEDQEYIWASLRLCDACDLMTGGTRWGS